MPPVFAMSRISKHFGGVHALEGVDMDLLPGEILGLVGDNGAGKSTMLKIMTGAYTPDGGQLYFDGRPVAIRSPRHSREMGIEMVYQHLALCRKLDVASNLFLGRELCASFLGIFKFLRQKRMERLALETLRELKINIKDHRDIVANLSGGQQQAIAIGKAVRFGPKMVLMDEPTANLAVREASKVLDLMVRLKNDGIGIVFVTHRLQDIFEVCDRVLILKGGRRVDCCAIADIDREQMVKMMFLGKEET